MMELIQADTYFDGDRLHRHGPYLLEIADGVCRTIRTGSDPRADRSGRLLLPTPVEAHAHLFLDGDELNPERRAAYLRRSREELLAGARNNVRRYRDAGITAIRDAGDIHGINLQLRDEFAGTDIHIVSAGHGLRREGRYGSFLAKPFDPAAQAPFAAWASGTDMVKIVLTGIIDFENGEVKGNPQFSEAETRAIVNAAHARGLKTFAHCSGTAGLRIAATAGVDTIEHGFFMPSEVLELMAEKQIAWTPTLLPVHVQWAHPEYCGWNPATVDKLRGILDDHRANLLRAEALGIPILAGSDAGSYGVPHAAGLWSELELLRQTGLREETVWRSAISEPRRIFGLPPVRVAVGEPADWVLMQDARSGAENVFRLT